MKKWNRPIIMNLGIQHTKNTCNSSFLTDAVWCCGKTFYTIADLKAHQDGPTLNGFTQHCGLTKS